MSKDLNLVRWRTRWFKSVVKCFFLLSSSSVQQLVSLSIFIVSEISFNMLSRIYISLSIYQSHISSHSKSKYSSDELSSLQEQTWAHFSLSQRFFFSQSSASDLSDTNYIRGKDSLRHLTSQEATTLKKIWDQLFDEDDHLTIRLDQLLQELAVHIIRMTLRWVITDCTL